MILFPLMLAAALAAGNAEFDAAANDGALSVAVSRENTRLRKEGPKAGAMKAKMLAAPGDYETAAAAKERCRTEYFELMTTELVAARTAIAARLGVRPYVASDKAGDFAEAEWLPVFERRFAAERKAACEEQAKTIAAKVKPSEADFGRKDEAEIRSELAAAVIAQQQTVVFEENRKYVSEQIVEPVMASAKKEIKRQRDSLKRLRCDAYAPSVLERELAEKLAKSVSERNAKSDGEAIVWGVFPIVAVDGVKGEADRRVLERVADAVDGVNVDIDQAKVRGIIAADREHHRLAADSERTFRGDFTLILVSNAVAEVAAEAPEAERDEFRAYVTERSADSSFGKAVETRVRRELLPRLCEVRGRIAAEDAVRFWPTLMDGTWFPEPSLADDVCARSDYAAAVKRWRDSPELVTLARAGTGYVLIEETEKLADGRVAKAFDLARSAINAQNAVLDRAVPEVRAEAERRKSGWFSRTPDFDKLVEMLSEAVTAKWDATRMAVLWGEEERPANAAEQHRELFPSVRRRIELEAKSILDELEPEEPPEEPAEASEDVETPPEAQEFSVSVRRSGNALETQIRRGEETLFRKSCQAEADEFRSVSRDVSEKLIEVLELK